MMLLAKAARSCCCNFYVLLLVAYFLLYQYGRLHFYADPTSYFFNPAKAFAPGYSARRQEEASTFLENSPNFPFQRQYHNTNPKICIGIATVTREGVHYLHLSVGSVLQGLTFEERQQIELKVLVAHTDPTRHPNWNSTWLHSVADQVLDYGPEFNNQSYIQELEGNVDKESAKSLFDYTYLLQSCKDSGAEYALMLEDDTVSAQGWYARVVEGLEAIKAKMTKWGYTPERFLYLRLFYTEKFLGWNSESKTTYIILSVLTIALPLTLFLIPLSTRPKLVQPPPTILFLSFIYAPMLIALFFASGRPSVLPISRGVQWMPKYACCTQGMIFPSSSIDGVVAWLDEKRNEGTKEFTDHLIEKYADGDAQRRLRWALTPSTVQHIGQKSSKVGADGGWGSAGRMDPRARLWSFAFEREGERLGRGRSYG